MPLHQQVTTCRKSGGPLSNRCSCEHCCLAVCEICNGAEGTLTTDCPGKKVDADRHQEVYETNLDYADEKGWHQGDPMERRTPRFAKEAPAAAEKPPAALPAATHLPRIAGLNAPPGRVGAVRIVGCSCGWQCPPGAQNSDDEFTLHAARAYFGPGNTTAVDWARIRRTTDLKDELVQKVIAWVLADRVADDHSATLARLEDEVDVRLPKGQEQSWLTEPNRKLLGMLESAKIDFRLADQRAEKCDDDFRQAARKLVDALEHGAQDDPAP